MTYALLIPAAGRGERLGRPESKALVMLAGRPLICWALDAFRDDERLYEVVVAVSPELHSEFGVALASHPLLDKVCLANGGATRQDSVGLALAQVTTSIESILVHDAARPFVSRNVIDAVLQGLTKYTASVCGIPVADTIKRVNLKTSVVHDTLSREELVAVQTPQGIRAEEFRKAHQLARQSHVQCTDDVALIERFKLGFVSVTPGDPRNFKITDEPDLLRAEEMIHARAL